VTRTSSSLDVRIGRRVRVRRLALGLPQHLAACALGVSAQQIRKYERGLNRISAGKLPALCKLLQTDAAALFGGLEDDQPLLQKTGASGPDMLGEWECFQFATAFRQIQSVTVQRSLVALLDCLG
jgi:transcriptional regulator with XRE-family HTH domain